MLHNSYCRSNATVTQSQPGKKTKGEAFRRAGQRGKLFQEETPATNHTERGQIVRAECNINPTTYSQRRGFVGVWSCGAVSARAVDMLQFSDGGEQPQSDTTQEQRHETPHKTRRGRTGRVVTASREHKHGARHARLLTLFTLDTNTERRK